MLGNHDLEAHGHGAVAILRTLDTRKNKGGKRSPSSGGKHPKSREPDHAKGVQLGQGVHERDLAVVRLIIAEGGPTGRVRGSKLTRGDAIHFAMASCKKEPITLEVSQEQEKSPHEISTVRGNCK